MEWLTDRWIWVAVLVAVISLLVCYLWKAQPRHGDGAGQSALPDLSGFCHGQQSPYTRAPTPGKRYHERYHERADGSV